MALEAIAPIRAKLVRSYRGGQRWAHPKIRYELERTLHWLAGRMTEPIVVPNEDVPDDEIYEDAPSDDPGASPAPVPLTVIPPSQSEPLRLHPLSTQRPFTAGRLQRKSRRASEARAMAEAFPKADNDKTGDSSEGARWWGNRGVSKVRGPSGAPMGRPPRGARTPETAEQRLLAACSGCSIEQLREVAATRGRPRAELRARRAVLERAVATIRANQSVTNEALAAVLGCAVSTIHRLRRAGEQLAA